MKDVCISAAERAAQLASAIKAVGIKAGGRVGIYAPNVPNWMLVIQACNRSSLQVGEPHVQTSEHTAHVALTGPLFVQCKTLVSIVLA